MRDRLFSEPMMGQTSRALLMGSDRKGKMKEATFVELRRWKLPVDLVNVLVERALTGQEFVSIFAPHPISQYFQNDR